MQGMHIDILRVRLIDSSGDIAVAQTRRKRARFDGVDPARARGDVRQRGEFVQCLQLPGAGDIECATR